MSLLGLVLGVESLGCWNRENNLTLSVSGGSTDFGDIGFLVLPAVRLEDRSEEGVSGFLVLPVVRLEDRSEEEGVS